jgi:hypothetical protein
MKTDKKKHGGKIMEVGKTFVPECKKTVEAPE